MIPVYVLTSDKYINTLKGFAHLFNKYWGIDQAVVVLGFTPPAFELPYNFLFKSLGNFSDYPVNKWSDALIKFQETEAPPNYVLFFEDYWLVQPVKLDIVNEIYRWMQKQRNVVKFDLATDRQFAGGVREVGTLSVIPHIDLLESARYSPYHMSLYIGMYQRDSLAQVLIPGETPWDVEIAGTTRLSDQNELKVYGSKQNPVKISLIHRNGNSKDYLLDELCEEDRLEIKELYGW